MSSPALALRETVCLRGRSPCAFVHAFDPLQHRCLVDASIGSILILQSLNMSHREGYYSDQWAKPGLDREDLAPSRHPHEASSRR